MLLNFDMNEDGESGRRPDGGLPHKNDITGYEQIYKICRHSKEMIL